MNPRRQPPKKKTQLRGSPLHNPVSIENRYARELRALAREMTKETKAEVLELFRSPDAKEFFAQDASIAIRARQMLNLLTAKFDRLYSRHAERLSRRMVQQVDDNSKAALQQSFNKLTAEVTLKVSDMSPALRTMFEASVSENVDLIKSIPAQYLDRVKGSVNRSITGTGGIGPLIEDIQKYGGMTERRSKNIALDQCRKAYQAVNVQRTKDAGIKKGIWIHTGGTKEPRKLHREFNGKEFSLSEGAPIGDKGENVMPGECVNCFTGDTLLQDGKGLKKLFRRFYTGKLAHIVTDNGAVLKVTPNHPILTNRGWVAAGELKSGDYVVKTVAHGSVGVNTHIDDAVASFKDVFESFLFVFNASSPISGGAAFNFHGDHSNGNVDIVFIDRCLPSGIKPETAKMIIEDLLTYPCVGVVDCPSFSSAYQLIMRTFDTPDRIVRGLRPLLSALWSVRSHADLVSLGMPSNLHACFLEAVGDGRSGYIEPFGEFQDADARSVKFANLLVRQILALTALPISWDDKAGFPDPFGEVVRINAEELGDIAQSGTINNHYDRIAYNGIISFSGHVFNLENEVNWYTANNTTAHNCRCTFVPVVNFEDM